VGFKPDLDNQLVSTTTTTTTKTRCLQEYSAKHSPGRPAQNWTFWTDAIQHDLNDLVWSGKKRNSSLSFEKLGIGMWPIVYITWVELSFYWFFIIFSTTCFLAIVLA